MVSAKQWVLKNEADPNHDFNFDMGTSGSTFEMLDVELSSEQVKEGQLLVQTQYLSNDPAQKFWICSGDKNYAAGVAIGEVIPARGIVKVLFSRNQNVKQDEYLAGPIGWRTHAVIEDVSVYSKVSLRAVGELWGHLSVLGSTALTAYFIFKEYLNVAQDESGHHKVFLISGAAGSVGSLCIQLALNVYKASKVIAVAGGAEKVKYVESFGQQVVGVDYKDPEFKKNLLAASGGANTVDYFIDNVGGDILDIGIDLLKVHAVITACGSISGYTDASKFVLKNSSRILTKRLVIKGMLVTDHANKFPEAIEQLASYVQSGEISLEKSATIRDATGDAFKDVPLIWRGLFQGINKGKLITKVSA
ncbi:AGL360Wp [Eremothecium gossypii ATCC 10895]|uniref:AGL360Wp n=1 Tax=Eremothecium gossypii (strain ATCC 10895 / CBS 109.51 / FGSC 9923 / NRRL Y-1056) TaxID=284811 RepID=Q751P9_EREGS|nr:AGL360Wp [Eremothecium gossypii ATCC 10895]AAS54131.1 AGL360Wp [Eremothecium gossypii ATCC 10895]AEY98457.1 FAGL360Wp [Eremothecium gossypii FDAG1]